MAAVTPPRPARAAAAAPAGSGDAAEGSVRLALRGEPDRLRRERASLQHDIQALSLTNFQVHIANFHCEENVRAELGGAVAAVPALAGTVSALASDAEGLEADLARLHSEHTRLRRSLMQHNSLLELLEAPSVMEACVRSGLLDEALDVADYASGLFFTHKLWAAALEGATEAASGEVPPPSSPLAQRAASASGGGGGGGGSAADIVRQVVVEIRALAGDVRDSILAQLAGGRVTLPLALKLLGHLRRLYTQQALARKRSGAHLAAAATAASAASSSAGAAAPAAARNGASSSSSSPAPASLDASAFAITPDEDASIVRRVRREFLGARDAWHRAELDAIPRHNSYQYVSAGRPPKELTDRRGCWRAGNTTRAHLFPPPAIPTRPIWIPTPPLQILRVVEAQRSQWADIASQYAAVCSTIRPQHTAASGGGSGDSGGGSGQPPAGGAAASAAAAAAALAADQASARALLSTWAAGRTAWFLRQLTAAVGAVDNGANLASLLAQSTYAARRAGRLGADYSHLLPPIFTARARALFSDRLRASAATFRDDVSSWAWAYKLGHDPNNATTTSSTTPTAAAGGASKDAAAPSSEPPTPLAPPLSLMRFQPLAELTNGLLLAYTAVRPVVPVDAAAAGWLRAEAFSLLEAAFTAAADAVTAPASPLAPLAAAAANRAHRRGGGETPSTPSLGDDDALAVQRFTGLASSLGDTWAPYVLLVVQHLAGGPSLATTGFDNPAGTTMSLESAVAAKSIGDPQLDAAWALAKRRAAVVTGAVADVWAAPPLPQQAGGQRGGGGGAR
jgi:hypothetical protein